MTTDTDNRQDLIDRAANLIGATRYARETLFAYVDDNEPATVYLVTDEDMVDLGGRLAAGEPDAYSRWCSETTADSTSAQAIVAALPDDKPLSITALRDEAASAGDVMTVAACDHIPASIRLCHENGGVL